MSRSSPAERLSRVVIEAIEPEVDGARFPVKRTLGEEVRVQADVFADGHDRLAGVLRYRLTEAPLETGALAEDRDWHEVAIESLGNDRFGASFTVRALGRYEYTVQAWIDRLLSASVPAGAFHTPRAPSRCAKDARNAADSITTSRYLSRVAAAGRAR